MLGSGQRSLSVDAGLQPRTEELESPGAESSGQACTETAAGSPSLGINRKAGMIPGKVMSI